MREKTKDKLREEWHGPFSADHVARRHHLPVGTVRNFWTEEKKAGRLPNLPCRPAFAARNPPPDPPEPPAPVDSPEIDFDDCDQVFGVVGDPLGEALRREHGDDRCRRAERDAADMLESLDARLDNARLVDGRPSGPWHAPSQATCRALALNYDAAMRRIANRNTRTK